ncbi:MAG: S1 RNA-binding domain-containing protein, partial [Chloroflexi bacterium]
MPTGLTDSDAPEDLTRAFADSLEDYLNQEEVSNKPLAHGDIIDGVVVRVDPDEILVDVGSKSEGVISGREL